MGRNKMPEGEVKKVYVKVVCTVEFRENLKLFCKANDIKMADFSRQAITNYMSVYQFLKEKEEVKNEIPPHANVEHDGEQQPITKTN